MKLRIIISICIILVFFISFFIYSQTKPLDSQTKTLNSSPTNNSENANEIITIEEGESRIDLNSENANEIITIEEGENRIDLNSDGILDLVLKLRRNNGTSPHGYYLYVFGMFATSTLQYGENPQPFWQEISIYQKQDMPTINENIHGIWDETDGKLRDTISTFEGAEGNLVDIKLLKTDNNIMLVVARRDFGKSYSDKRFVMFDFYELKLNSDGDWKSDYYYQYKISIISEQQYVDVETAFRNELWKQYYKVTKSLE